MRTEFLLSGYLINKNKTINYTFVLRALVIISDSFIWKCCHFNNRYQVVGRIVSYVNQYQ